jgi:hypothetical protein
MRKKNSSSVVSKNGQVVVGGVDEDYSAPAGEKTDDDVDRVHNELKVNYHDN